MSTCSCRGLREGSEGRGLRGRGLRERSLRERGLWEKGLRGRERGLRGRSLNRLVAFSSSVFPSTGKRNVIVICLVIYWEPFSLSTYM